MRRHASLCLAIDSHDVNRSSSAKYCIACPLSTPHISAAGFKLPHTAGRSGWPKIRQRKSLSSCTHRMPAGLPLGIPGIGEEIDGAMQHAPQPGRHAKSPSRMTLRPADPASLECRPRRPIRPSYQSMHRQPKYAQKRMGFYRQSLRFRRSPWCVAFYF